MDSHPKWDDVLLLQAELLDLRMVSVVHDTFRIVKIKATALKTA